MEKNAISESDVGFTETRKGKGFTRNPADITTEQAAVEYCLHRLAGYIYDENWDALIQEEKDYTKKKAKELINKTR